MKCLFPERRSIVTPLFHALLSGGFLLLFVFQTQAANRYWVATTAGNWNNATNWSSTSGGTGGSAVPGAGDAVFFNSGGPGNCVIDIPVDITRITEDATYTGTISQGSNTINISNTATFAGGVFIGGSAGISISGTFTLSGTAFTSTSAVLELQANALFTGGTFAHNNGTVRYNGVSVGAPTLSGTSPSFYILELVGLGKTYAFSSAGDILISHALNISGSAACTLNTGVFDVLGDINITNTATGGGGNALINIDGTGVQYFNGGSAAGVGALPQLTINSTGSVMLSGFPSVGNNFIYTAGSVIPGSSTFCFTRSNSNNYSITGSISLNNLQFIADATLTTTISAGTLLTVTGTLATGGSANLNINADVAAATAIQAQGDILIGNSSTGGGGNAGILINGAGTQAFTSLVAAGLGRVPYITIQKASGSLVLSGVISERRNWTYNSGSVDAATYASTVVFGGSPITITSNGMSFYHVSISSNTSTLANDLTVLGDLTISGGSLSAAANTIYLGGNWINSANGFNRGTGTVNFRGSGLQTIGNATGENFYNLTVNNTGAGIQLLNDITIRNELDMTLGNIDLNGMQLTLGVSVGVDGTLVHSSGTMINTGSFTRWFAKTTISDGSVDGLFPVGTATDYRPFYVSVPVTRPTSGGTLTVTYSDAATNTAVTIPDGASTVFVRKDLHWSLATGNGLNGGTYNLDAQGTGFGQIGGVNDLRLTLVNSTIGTAGVNTGTITDPQINRTGLSSANLNNTFYIGSVDPVSTTLPVSLISFTAIAENGIVRLDWKTAAEISNDYFTVQRSSDAQNWKDLKLVSGSGNSRVESAYSAYDANPLSGISYYRLEQTDQDGKESFSFVREVNLNTQTAILVYPNPAINEINVAGSYSGRMDILLFNSNGQTIQVPSSNQGSKTTFYISAVPAGIYYIRICLGKSFQTRVVEIKK